ncbi:MAG: pilus assembly protein PilM [Clostridia bacterium]|nr:pilus assembly protein PilM [Clostridia bacterium]
MAKVNSAVGIEYNSYEIKAVELTKTAEGKIEVTSSASTRLQEGVISEGIIADSSLFTAALGDLFEQGDFKKDSPIVVGVNNENVIMRYATFPKVPQDKLRSVVTMQAQDFIPVPVSELGLDFVVVDETTDDDDQPALNMILVGARNTMLTNLLQNFEAAKCEVVDIDSSFLAWCRAAIDEAPETSTFAYLSLTDDVLNFVAIVDKDIKMVRSINIPDRALIEVKKAFHSPEELTSLEMETVIELLQSELTSSMNYFQMQTNMIIESVLFTTASALEGELATQLAERIYVPLTVPSFYENYANASFSPKEYAGCISLAQIGLEA